MPTEEPTGLIAGRYQILELLGRGGMGHVRAGLDRQLDRPVAIKFLRADLADQPKLRERFEREARAAARVSHPNVVVVFDIGEHDDVPYIVMERLSGRTLADELVAGAMSGDRVRTIASELLDGLGAAHRLGVLHRDIKPGNILLTDTAQVKLADFGIAKLDDDRQDTTIGSVFGTVSYLAPERLAGQPATQATDVYSVGVVLFEALTGAPAFRAETPLALARAVAHDQPTFTEQHRRALDPALVGAVERAIDKDPDARFASTDEMAAALTGPVSPAQIPTVRGVLADTEARTSAAETAVAPTVPVATEPRTGSAPRADTKRPPAAVAPTALLPTHMDSAGPRSDAEGLAETSSPGRPATFDTQRSRRTRRAVTGGLLLIGILVVAVLLGTLGSGSSTPSSTPPSTPTSGPSPVPSGTGTSMPAPLAHAIDALNRAAR
ncbi:MAG: protein kinase [Acidimicrobiia bacterium]